MALSATILGQIAATLTSAIDLGEASANYKAQKSIRLAEGVGAGQANTIFVDSRQLAASASENLDLSGVLANAYGTTIAFTKVKAIMVVAADTNTNAVVVGGAASNGFIAPFGAADDTVKVRPGGFLLLAAPDVTGYAVTAATADQLKIANGGGTTVVDYDIVIIGVS